MTGPPQARRAVAAELPEPAIARRAKETCDARPDWGSRRASQTAKDAARETTTVRLDENALARSVATLGAGTDITDAARSSVQNLARKSVDRYDPGGGGGAPARERFARAAAAAAERDDGHLLIAAKNVVDTLRLGPLQTSLDVYARAGTDRSSQSRLEMRQNVAEIIRSALLDAQRKTHLDVWVPRRSTTRSSRGSPRRYET